MSILKKKTLDNRKPRASWFGLVLLIVDIQKRNALGIGNLPYELLCSHDVLERS